MDITSPPITPEILKLVAEIDEFKGRWRALKTLSPETLQHLRKIATIESVGSSTRIEGAKLSDREVAALLSGLGMDSFRNRDEEEVAGYAAAMEMVFDGWDTISLTENCIRQLHKVLLQFSGKDERHRGEYKKNPNNVAAFDAQDQQIGIVFETASPFETPFEMEKLVKWIADAQQDGQWHPLLITAVFVVWFLAIHPFQDGNGRLSRILTTLLLLRFGYAYVPFASLESIIEDSKGGYYSALRKTQQSMKSDAPDWGPWVTFFLRCLTRQTHKLESRIKTEETALAELSGLSLAIVNLLEAELTVTVASVVAATGANRNTVKAALQGLVRRGLIAQKGKGRGVHYTLLT
jgi:Fic family protein